MTKKARLPSHNQSTGLPSRILDDQETKRVLKNDLVRSAFPALASISLHSSSCCGVKARENANAVRQARGIIARMSAGDQTKLKDLLKVRSLTVYFQDDSGRTTHVIL